MPQPVVIVKVAKGWFELGLGPMLFITWVSQSFVLESLGLIIVGIEFPPLKVVGRR